MKKIYFTLITLLSLPVFGQIQQDVNKTNGTESNPITEIDSIRFNGSMTEMEIILDNGNVESHTMSDIDNVTFSGQLVGIIDGIDCANASITGTLVEGTAASGVSADIDYTGGNGGPHNGQTVNSTGVTGLTADLTAGSFVNGAGALTYTITGTPNSGGTASFAIQTGGMSCILEVSVDASVGSYPSGTVHCSATPTAVVDVTNPITGDTWMDRNLGASQVATTSTDTDAFGDLYQWGRFADGHQCRTSPTTSTLSNADQPGHGDFIIVSSGPEDWRSPQNDNLWQGVAGVNNPCPTGYRVPTEAEVLNEAGTWSTGNANGAFGSPLKLAMSGFRSGSSGSITGGSGRYWTSTVDGSDAKNLQFFTNGSSLPSVRRALGYSIRCIKD